MTNQKKENKLTDNRNCHTLSFMRNSYLEIRNPVKNFKIIGQKQGRWAYYDKDKNLVFDISKAKFQKWIKFSDVE